ncbi:hypothetical protein FQR65_LT20404 [Abscondita terminalis]|nr:hypothetical protein FQR65_LT20404 [Abscondita terminalis]
MVRATAKNHANAAIVVSPGRYDEVIAAVRAGGTTLTQRRSLATEAFIHTANYDGAVANWFLDREDEAWGEAGVDGSAGGDQDAGSASACRHSGAPMAAAGVSHALGIEIFGLREPCCATARTATSAARCYGVSGGAGIAQAASCTAKKCRTTTTSDADAATAGSRLSERSGGPRFIKHANPCVSRWPRGRRRPHRGGGTRFAQRLRSGVGVSACDAANREVTRGMAEAVAEIFTEVIVAPAFAPEALAILTQKKNVRLLVLPADFTPNPVELRQVSGGFLLQDADRNVRPRLRVPGWLTGTAADAETSHDSSSARVLAPSRQRFRSASSPSRSMRGSPSRSCLNYRAAYFKRQPRWVRPFPRPSSVSSSSRGARASFVGGGGIGDFAMRYGYQQYDFTLMYTTILLIISCVGCCSGSATASHAHSINARPDPHFDPATHSPGNTNTRESQQDMKRPLIASIAIAAAALFVLSGCTPGSGATTEPKTEKSAGETVVLKVAATTTPMPEIVKAAGEAIEAPYSIELVEVADYVQPNTMLEAGELDANFVQHKPFMEEFNRGNNASLVAIEPVYLTVVGIYSSKHDSMQAIPDGGRIVIPQDISNQARALRCRDAASDARPMSIRAGNHQRHHRKPKEAGVCHATVMARSGLSSHRVPHCTSRGKRQHGKTCIAVSRFPSSLSRSSPAKTTRSHQR